MTTRKAILIIGVLSLAFAANVFGAPLKVYISASSTPAKEIASSLEARLKATERYTVWDQDGAQLQIAIACFNGKEVSGSNGYICSYLFIFYPDQATLFQNTMGSLGLITGNSVTYVAENIFTEFVNATTAEKLEEARGRMRVGILAYCKNSQPDQYAKDVCGQDLPKPQK